MLRELTISNFKSIGPEVTFSMEADVERVSELPNHVISVNGVNMLRVASMYGPNGGGKTNILDALLTIFYIVNGNYVNNKWQLPNIYTKDDKIIKEEAYFISEEFEIGYRIYFKTSFEEAINQINIGITKTYFDIVEEEIVYRKNGESEFEQLLTRNENGKIFSEKLEKEGYPLKIILGTRFSAITYFNNTYTNLNAKDLPDSIRIINELYNQIMNIKVLNSEPTKNQIRDVINNKKEILIDCLNKVDIKISDVYIDEKNNIYFVRKFSDQNSTENKKLNFIHESAGTKKIFFIFILILCSDMKTSIFYADDLNAYLHPKLFEAVVGIFNSNVNNFGQLIFNSHEILCMNNNNFRRDEIWFVYRDENYLTRLISLSNIVNFKGEQIRKDATYYKQYLEGRYGADPFISKGLTWRLDNESKK